MIVRHGRGTMALCHNGNLTNAVELRRQLENEGAIFHGSSDTEVICYLITRNRLRMGSIETAISKTMDVLEGAYSLVIMSATKLIAVRDPRGYRPLCIGTLPGGGYVFASESCALDATDASLLRDVEPGEIVVVDTKTGELRSIKDHCGRPDTQMCVFEFIYFARPDSVIEAARCTRPASRQAASLHRSTPWRPMWSSACRIPAWMQHWATRRRAASPTASALSKTNTSAAPSFRAARSSARTACASS